MHRTLETLLILGILVLPPAVRAQNSASDPAIPASISIPYEATQNGLLTLVLEDEHGNRVKNLIADYAVHQGHNIIPWDGSSLDGVAAPGHYHVRGLFHQRIVPRLEYSIYSPGAPPWPTADGTGAWLADHTPPASALFLPEGSPWPTHSGQLQILFGAQAAEAGHALMWTDLDGRKLDGIKIRGWNGGIALARDNGPNRNPDHIAYTVYVVNPSRDFGKTDPGALQIFAITKTGLAPLAKVVGGIQTHDAFRQLVGLAAANGLLLLSNPAANEIVAFDVRHNVQTPFATIKLPHLGALAFEPDGQLLVATEGGITRFTVVNDWHTLKLVDPRVVVAAAQLESPKQIIESHDFGETGGEIYVTDWGSSHQVKVFSVATGRPLRVIGHPGGPQVGLYDEQRMAHPLGMAIDSNGVLWVAEEDYLPKRISRWDAKTGRFLNAWYGPTQYGGGGFADPHDLYRAYYPSIGNPGSMGLLEFRVDPATGSSRLTAVRYRFPDPLNDIISYGGYPPGPIFFPNDMIPVGSHGGIAPAQTFYRDGHQYFTDSYNTYWYNQTTVTTLWILEHGVCHPIASAGWVGASGSAHHWTTLDRPEIRRRIPSGNPDQTFFVWTDRNHDHAVQPDEVEFLRPAVPGAAGVVFQPDLSIISGGPYHLHTASIDAAGIPAYNLARLTLVSHTSAIGEVALSPDGWFLAGMSGYKDGELRWTLPTRSASVPPAGPGDLQDPKRMLGYPVRPARGDAGYLVARYSYMGEIYIYTVDGLLVATLGRDTRLSPFWPYPKQTPGMEITGLSFDAEHFWPFMFGNDNGNVYLAIGKWHTSIVRLDGLDSVQRVDLGTITVSKQELARTAPLRVESLSREKLKTEVEVHHLVAAVKASPENWPQKDWAAIDKNSFFQLGTDGKNLIVAYRTDQPDLLRNSATEFPFAFTQGGGLDLMVRASGPSDDRHAAAGDARLFITRRNGKLLAVLYRQKTEKPGNRVSFASPVGEVAFDDVQDVSDRVMLFADKGFYQLSVPLSLLGLDPSPGRQYRGDVGFVLSDGTRAQARVYWHNKTDAMTADVPSEARLNPGQWGVFHF
jgi:hypothetical protein